MSDDYLKIPATPEEEIAVNQANWWKSIFAIVLFLCAWAYLEPYHLDFFAPMQRFWRVVTMVGVCYFCLVLVLLNHRPKYGRFILGYLDPRLNQEVTKGHHTYDDDCDFAHWVDWFLQTFMMRDAFLSHFWQIGDELIELSWQHILPHFRECWWDHIFSDILLSNIPAVTLSLYIQRKYGFLQYDYWGREGKKSWTEWEIWHCHKRFGQMLLI